jgi:hypothetical protein
VILALAPFGARTRRRLDRGKGTISGAETGGGRTEAESRIIQRSIEDDAFRQRLLEDPKAAVEQEIGTQLPDEVRVVAVEETADTIYLVLPGTPMAGGGGEELSDQQLESVAGGGSWGADTCQNTCGAGCTPNCTGDFICTSG